MDEVEFSIDFKKMESRSVDEQQENVDEIQCQETSEQSLAMRPQHLKDSSRIEKISKQTLSKLEQSKNLSWDKEFKSSFTVNLLQTNFQQMKVQLQYGNIKLTISLIFTQISQNIFKKSYCESGSFGTVRYFEYQGNEYAMKCIKIAEGVKDSDLVGVYREYFMGFAAGVIGVGPRVVALFGFDVVICNGMAFFTMERCGEPQKGVGSHIEEEMMQNLEVIHSINFIHNDIKPANMAFSKTANRHVFIDFGLSKLIRQKPGEKTRTKFQGTLSYCSDQMKRCYILNSACFIDLYANDLHCLKKSIRMFKEPILIHDQLSFQDDEYEREGPEGAQAVFGDLGLVLRLKAQLRDGGVQGVLEVLDDAGSMAQTVYEILISSQVPKNFYENQSFKQKIEDLKALIYNSDFKPSPIDSLLCSIFNTKSRKQILQKIIPISYMLKSQASDFNDLLKNKDWVYKLFVFIDPFIGNDEGILEEDIKLKRKIINKIYETKNFSCESLFFWEKAKFVLNFFYDSLKSLRKSKVFLTLRLLFLSLEDYGLVSQMEVEALELIQDPVLKILKIIQFSMLWDSVSQDFDHDFKTKWRDQIYKKSTDHPVQSIVRNLALRLLRKNRYFIITQDQKLTDRKFIEEIESLELQNDQKQAIQSIKYSYFQLTKYKPPNFSLPRTFTFKIYTRFYIGFKLKLQESSAIQKHHLMFRPIMEQFNQEIKLQPSRRQIFEKILLENYFYQLKNSRVFSKYSSEQMPNLVYFRKKAFLSFLERGKLCFSLDEAQQSVYRIHFKIYFISHAIEILQRNDIASPSEMLTNEESKNCIQLLENVLETIISNKNFMSDSSESIDIRIYAYSLKVTLLIRKGYLESQIKAKMEQILDIMKPLPVENPNVLPFFLYIFRNLKEKLHGTQPHFSQDVILYLAHEYSINKAYYIFQKQSAMLGIIIVLRNRRDQHHYSLNLIKQLIDHFRKKKNAFEPQHHLIALVYSIWCFCQNLSTEKLKAIYEQLKLDPMMNSCGYYRYLLFTVFFVVGMKNEFEEDYVIQHLKKSALGFVQMPTLFENTARIFFYWLFHKYKWCKNKRKALICARREARTKQPTGKPLISELKQKIKQLHKKIPQEIHIRLKQASMKIH